MICIVDYGVGNTGSIRNMIKKVGYRAEISGDSSVISAADALILPGVGAFDYGMEKLRSSGLDRLLDEEVLRKKKPILGICLGMQLMTRGSEEGERPGLGWVDAEVKRFESEEIKIPHMGWNLVRKVHSSPLTDDLYEENRFYFVHSYYVRCRNPEDVILETEYGTRFVSGFGHENIFGVQFHPEKSHKFGKRLLENFCRLGECRC